LPPKTPQTPMYDYLCKGLYAFPENFEGNIDFPC
jgi:hypothetical protein